MITYTNLLEKISERYKEKLPFVVYKKPDSKFVSGVFQDDSRLFTVKDYSEKGFVFAPFDDSLETVLIPADKIIHAPYENIELSKTKEAKIFDENEKSRERHVEFVDETIKYIIESEVSKIVIARTKEISYSDFELISIFERLLSKYPMATSYVWYHPKVGLWLGATPEMLLQIEGANFKTMSLAGTQQFVDTIDVSWGAKEIEEQQLVTDYVVSNLKKEAEEIYSSKTYTAKAGSLLHLRTDISGSIIKEKGIETLLKILHPTPAVCGFPSSESKEFILKNENFDRSYYTGFFGELNIEEKTSLYVNLRCMQVINENLIRLYVGGGITDKSDAEKEWKETMAKCKTMESVL